MQTAPHNSDKPGIPSLVSGIFQDTLNLISKELTAARLEVHDELDKTKSTVMLISLGAGALMVGSIFLGHMLVHLLQKMTGFELWACYAFIGAALVPLGIIVLYLARQRARTTSLIPKESVENAKEDARWITRRVKSDAR